MNSSHPQQGSSDSAGHFGSDEPSAPLPDNGLPPVFESIEQLMSFLPLWVGWIEKQHARRVPEPQDVAQQAMLELWLWRSRKDLPVARGLVFKVLHARAIDALRARGREANCLANDVDVQEIEVGQSTDCDGGSSAEDEMARREESELVPEMMRWFLEGRIALDGSMAMIAEAIGPHIEADDIEYAAIARTCGLDRSVVSRRMGDIFKGLAANHGLRIADDMTYDAFIKALAAAYRKARFPSTAR